MLDYSIDSLLILEQWLYSKVAFRDKTKSEIEWEDENLSIKYETEFSTKILDDRSISLCVDVGIYFAEVVRRHNPELEWQQVIKGKSYITYGHMVLKGKGGCRFAAYTYYNQSILLFSKRKKLRSKI